MIPNNSKWRDTEARSFTLTFPLPEAQPKAHKHTIMPGAEPLLAEAVSFVAADTTSGHTAPSESATAA